MVDHCDVVAHFELWWEVQFRGEGADEVVAHMLSTF